MRIAGMYSFNNGREDVERRYGPLLKEVQNIIRFVKASEHKTKESLEKTMHGKMLFSPSAINGAFKKQFALQNWYPKRVKCDYPTK